MKMHDLFEKIEQWAQDRNLVYGSNPKAQFVKLIEEFQGEPDDVKDSIGDTIVVLVIMLAQEGVTPRLHWDYRHDMGMKPDNLIGRLACKVARGNSTYSLVEQLFAHLEDKAKSHRLDVVDCVEHAWNEIKDRKGQMVDGVFVKEADLTIAMNQERTSLPAISMVKDEIPGYKEWMSYYTWVQTEPHGQDHYCIGLVYGNAVARTHDHRRVGELFLKHRDHFTDIPTAMM